MNRKQRRARQRALKKAKVESSFETKLGLFDLIPEDCVICHAPFDKTNKEMVQTWNVSVREKEKKVKVYCPTCWNKAKDLLNELGINNNEEQTKKED